MLPLLCSRQCSCQHLDRFQRSAAHTEDTVQLLSSSQPPRHSKTAQIEKDIASSVQTQPQDQQTQRSPPSGAGPTTRNPEQGQGCDLRSSVPQFVSPDPRNPTPRRQLATWEHEASCPLPREKATGAGRQSKPRQAIGEPSLWLPLVDLETARYCACAGAVS